MNDPAISIKDYLLAQGFGPFAGSSAFSLYIGHPPDKPDALILINATGGMSPHPRLLLNYPSVQVMVRGAPSGYVAATTKMKEVVAALLGMDTVVLNGDTYRGSHQIGDVSYLGQDDNTRSMHSANFRFDVEPAAVAGGHRVSI